MVDTFVYRNLSINRIILLHQCNSNNACKDMVHDIMLHYYTYVSKALVVVKEFKEKGKC